MMMVLEWYHMSPYDGVGMVPHVPIWWCWNGTTCPHMMVLEWYHMSPYTILLVRKWYRNGATCHIYQCLEMVSHSTYINVWKWCHTPHISMSGNGVTLHIYKCLEMVPHVPYIMMRKCYDIPLYIMMMVRECCHMSPYSLLLVCPHI